jgi:hypothetical protein
VSAAAALMAPVQPAASAYDPRRYESAASAPLPPRSREPADATKIESAPPPFLTSETCNAAPLPTRDTSPRLRGKRHFASDSSLSSASSSSDQLPSDIGALSARRRTMLSRSWAARQGSSATLARAMSGHCPTIRVWIFTVFSSQCHLRQLYLN